MVSSANKASAYRDLSTDYQARRREPVARIDRERDS